MDVFNGLGGAGISLYASDSTTIAPADIFDEPISNEEMELVELEIEAAQPYPYDPADIERILTKAGIKTSSNRVNSRAIGVLGLIGGAALGIFVGSRIFGRGCGR